MNSTRFENAHSNFDTAVDAHTLDQFGKINDLFNRMWTEANLINIRFKYSMLLHIGTDFVYLIANSYFTILCLVNYASCDAFALNVTGIIVSIFYVSSLSIAGQKMANEALQIAFEIHRNRHARSNIGLGSFVRLEHFHTIKFQVQKKIKSCAFCLRFDSFLFDCFTKQYGSMHSISLTSITRYFLR